MSYIHFRNLVMVPTVWVLSTVVAARALGVYISWRVALLVVFAVLLSDTIDYFVEGRPMAGPYRWKQRPLKE